MANHPAKTMNILIVDDDTGHRTMLKTLIEGWGYKTTLAMDGKEAVSLCQKQPFDLVLMDIRMPKKSGIEALIEIKEEQHDMPILIMTAFSNVETAVEAIKSGAYDYLTKPLDFEKLRLSIKNIFEVVDLKEKNHALTSALSSVTSSSGMIGKSEGIKQIFDMVVAIAPSEATVLITGESGTGKELIAKALHKSSQRSEGAYIAFNCAAITESLMESELFGHEKGAFTGADKRREGRFEQADKGTIFLDEIGEMPLLMQAKLLRVLQEREVQRVGGEKTIPIDVRVIAATNRNLAVEVREGRFREDLFYRLNVVALHLPALRERIEDILLLAQHFLLLFSAKNGKQLAGFTNHCKEALMQYPWPGNVRELENVIERAVVLALGDQVDVRDLPPHIVAPENPSSHQFNSPLLLDTKRFSNTTGTSIHISGAPEESSSLKTLETIEKQAIIDAISVCTNNKSEAAKRLGISRKTLYSKLEKYGLER